MVQKNKKEKLSEFIIDYLESLHDCLNQTTFTADRPGFKDSIVIVSSWLIKLKSETFDEVKAIIISSQTDKSILDSWKSGEWGEREASGLKALNDKIASI